MNKTKSLMIKVMVLLINLIILFSLVLLLSKQILIYEVFLALIFLQALVSGLLLARYFIYKRFKSLAGKLGFKIMSGFLEQPRMEGHYKNHWWQLHFVDKETGEYPGILRTYVKLQFKDKKFFNEKILAKYKNSKFKNNIIIEVKHVERPYKNYLLLKRAWFAFDRNKIHELMDFLLKVYDEARVDKK